MSAFHVLLIFHICGATIGVLSGAFAMVFRKGSGRHGAAGTVFVVAMVCMTGSAIYIASFIHPIAINVVAGTLTLYLVATGWWAAKRPDGGTSLFDFGALLVTLGNGMGAITVGIGAAQHKFGTSGVPIPMFFVFGTVALLFAFSDFRMLVRGGVFGAKRIARHLWRMSFALLITTASFYPGQAKLFPKWLRATSLLYIPHVLLIGAMIFWLYRVGRRQRVQNNKVIAVRQADPVAGRMVA
ncbi:MAG: hypothetical protein QOI24_610 [Acidobacteriota bacterium]|jgi:hypothetical protein|nr:hypothetical protein [Acidobacteriota bacterium]